MITFNNEQEFKVFDPDAYYAYTSVVHNDLYLKGTQHLFANELASCELAPKHGQLKIPNAVLYSDLVLAVDAFEEANFAQNVYVYAAQTRKAVQRLDRAVDKQEFGKLLKAFQQMKNALIKLMASANFFALYIDPQNQYKDALNAQLSEVMSGTEIADLMTQPKVTPFLNVLKLSGLKCGAKRSGVYRFLNQAYFLRGFDLNVTWEKIKDIDVFLNQLGCEECVEHNEQRYLKTQKEELQRQKKVLSLRARAFQHVADERALMLFLASVDGEELRHYWQARALHVLAKLMEYLQLNPSSSSLNDIEKKLEGFQ